MLLITNIIWILDNDLYEQLAVSINITIANGSNMPTDDFSVNFIKSIHIIVIIIQHITSK